MPTIVDQLCLSCHVNEPIPGEHVCESCMQGDSNSEWVPRPTFHLADLDELEHRPSEEPSSPWMRFLWWTLIVVAVTAIGMIAFGYIHIQFLDNIPFFTQGRSDLDQMASHANDNIQKLFSVL